VHNKKNDVIHSPRKITAQRRKLRDLIKRTDYYKERIDMKNVVCTPILLRTFSFAESVAETSGAT
jgi:hypothetical protein